MELGRLNLTTEEKEDLARKISLKIPFDEILDSVRDSIINEKILRIHLLTRQDLYNIELEFNLNRQSVRHHNDLVSVESWISEMQSKCSLVRFYKAQGETSHEYSKLKFDDFMLIFFNDAQLELLKQFGNDCVCIDGTHGLNAYKFELITLLVIDDMRQGFPCAFFITNRTDADALEIFFDIVKKNLGCQLQAKIFMSDMADAFYNRGIKVMPPVEMRLFCAWHVDRAWRKNLNKIVGTENQIKVYKNIRTLLEESDKNAFSIMLSQVLEDLSSDGNTLGFGEYFTSTYAKDPKTWAYCYRQHAGVNTNMHLARMHKSLKYIYLHQKNIKRVDKSLHSIMRLIKDKLIDRLIVITKGSYLKT